ncbi:hypothetical protein RDV84_22750 [Lysobacter yananisis]|uniref:DUF1902 domain-containing protein n=1 Tax=Lysobacter yananisis TaxID=1003114 RepID=A0ABY9P6S9_9GAMM|nr:hypothetical protein [Lysobacter yananisis]WMT02750.1 hypothetical protein RDV84_22750 [Lysobacter yananisis]
MPAWLSQTRNLPSLEAEVCFQIQDRFYYGPDRVSDPSDYERLAEKLAPPAIALVSPSMVRSAEALGHEAELAAYYRQIVRLARHHQRPFNSIRHYFWLRLWLWNSQQQAHIAFPWYDSYAEIDRVLKALVEIESGPVHDDADQGWEVQIHARGDAVYLLQRDPDEDEALAALCVPRAELARQVAQLRERTQGLIARLSGELGADVWTSYVRTEPTFAP